MIMDTRNAPLTEAERIALANFRTAYGREWKQFLLAAWRGGVYRGCRMAGQDTGILRGIRNQRGPTWLLDKCRPLDLEPPAPTA